MAERVFLHVGTPKSGTTYLQAGLWQRRDDLGRHGLLVPGRRPFDHNRASMAVRAGDHLPGPDGAVPKGPWARLAGAVRRHDGAAVLSNEWFLLAGPGQARAAVEQLGGPRVQVVVTTRSPVRLLPAAWQESLKVGRGTSLDDFVAALDGDRGKWTWDALDPAAVAARWADVVGPDRVTVVTSPLSSRDPGLLWRRFLEAMGLPGEAVEGPATEANTSLPVHAARLLQEFGPALRAEVDQVDPTWRGHARWLRTAVVRRGLAGLEGDPIGLGEDLLADLRRRAEESVASLRALGCPVVGDLDELLGGEDRPGARRPGDVGTDELLQAAEHLAVGLLRQRIAAAGDAGSPDDPEDGPDDTDERADERADDATDEARPGDRTRRWTFLVPSAYAAGGIARTVFTTANHLAARGHAVRVVTLSRSSAEPKFDLDPRVALIALQDRWDPEHPEKARPAVRNDPAADPADRALDREPSTLATATKRTFTALTDARLRAVLSEGPPGVVVSTRPEFAVAAARWSPEGSLLLHQEHLSFVPRPEPLRAALRAVATGTEPTTGGRRLDALLTLTEADHERWVDYLADPSVRTGVIPNATPFAIGDPAPLEAPVVVAAGRMTTQKGFDRLVDAWVPLTRSHPAWQLRIFGDGPLMDELAAQVAAADVGDRIVLGGVTRELEAELAGCAVYAMSSRYEGLPMVLLEAMSKGVPPVSFDCPEGPRQLIDDGRNGLLVPEGDVAGLTAALARLMDDADLRRRLGAEALGTARGYEAGAVVDRWVELAEQVDREQSGA